MKKLLISTALVASMGFAAGAFAQDAGAVNTSGDLLYSWVNASGATIQGTWAEYQAAIPGLPTLDANDDDAVSPAEQLAYDTALAAREAFVAEANVAMLTGEETNSLAGTQESLLQSLLSQAQDIQVSLANTSENLANIDGSISIDLSRFEEEFDVTAGIDGVTIMEPLNATIGELTTTVIGSLGDGSVISTSVLSNVEAVNQAMTQTSDALNLQFGDASSNLGLQQVYNLSSNLGALDASVDVIMAGVNLDELAGVATTAIGSLGTGAITANVTNNAAGLTERLIGTN